MKQKTKKLLQLSFSLGFLATTALVATSCNDTKTVTPKPSKPNPMQPGNGSGSGTGTTTPGTGETMQPGNGSGTETTTPDNTEAKNQLKALIDGKEAKLAMYDDYSMIKSTLANAYATAKTVDDKADATKDELANAKTTLETAIAKAATDKTEFDKTNKSLVDAFVSLKATFKSIDLANSLSTLGDDSIYDGIKNNVNEKYNAVKSIIDSGVQKDGLRQETLTDAKDALNTSLNKINDEKENVNSYSKFMLIPIKENDFKGTQKYNISSPDIQSIVSFASDFDNDATNGQYSKWKYAKRVIKNIQPSENSNQTNVRWIYNLNTKTEGNEEKIRAIYEFGFEYYGGTKATLFFPYKAIKNDLKGDKLSLKYKLNDQEEFADINVSNAEVDNIKIARIDLNDLNFGQNKITFTTEQNKVSPMIGNMYISISDKSLSYIQDDIFGNIKDVNKPDQITINFAKAYGLANKGIAVPNDMSTIITKVNGKIESVDDNSKDYYLLGYLGNSVSGGDQNNGATHEKYYIFYVNADKEGEYSISGYYNSGEDGRGLSFWTEMYNNTAQGAKAKFTTPKEGNWSDSIQKIKAFNSANVLDNNPTSLVLKKGINKIIVSGSRWNKEAPNLGNVTFTFKNATSSSMPA
ncbi:hypothetical protein LNO75_03860 [Mycoplasma sp. T363T]|uniref:Vmc-like lipoprotein signal peptide domain-containing protein n=1 Tax=Mycoplasma bradburyae TaxID=2963128 RepID=UPI00234021C8|nr:hypothetical protein [Mycoplasma bradburyae]MDC4163694.1 hypothetical protein [Mycoplasma bradburyae]